ncbi:MAG: cytochrome P450 [Hyphomicrobium sp.]
MLNELTKTAPLYPPTVAPAARALPLWLSLLRFTRNPLRSLPRAVYEQDIVVYGRKRPLVAWVTGSDLVEQILIKRTDVFAKTRLDRRVLKPLIGTGLLTAQGEHWRWQRKMASPLFRPNDALTYVPAMTQAAREQIERWRAKGAAHIAPIEIDMTETTFAVIARTILAGIDESEASEIQRTGYAFIRPIMWSVASALMLTPETWWYPGKAQMMRAAAENRATVQRLLDKRRAAGIEGDDLVARMLQARHPDTDAPMSDDELIDNLGTFLLAGHETTAKALTWTLYLLARSPEWQKRVREEIAAVTSGRQVCANDIAQLPLTQRVLKESMRLYPPVPAMTRVNLEATTLGGVTLPEPALIVVPVFAIHRHKATWEDPDRFDPDRFLPEREAQLKRTQFMPFGAGPRVCIGASFAMTEAIVVLASLLQHVRFSWDGTHNPEPISRVTLHPKGGMPLKVEILQGPPPDMVDKALN